MEDEKMSKIRGTIDIARKNAKVTDMFPSIKPEPMKITIKSEKNLPTSKSGKLRKCEDCIHSTPDCTYCNLLKKSIFPYQYACFSFIDDEEAKRRREEAAAKYAEEVSMKWKQIQKIEEQKCNWLLTLMIDMVIGSQILLEDFERRTDTMFKNNPFPDSKDVQDHKSDKDWIFKHKYAFASINKIYNSMASKFKDGCSKIRATFESTIQKHIVALCTDKQTKDFDEKLYTAIDDNAAEFTRLMMLVMNKVVGVNGNSNLEKIVDFVASLDGVDVFDPEDISRFKIR